MCAVYCLLSLSLSVLSDMIPKDREMTGINMPGSLELSFNKSIGRSIKMKMIHDSMIILVVLSDI